MGHSHEGEAVSSVEQTTELPLVGSESDGEEPTQLIPPIGPTWQQHYETLLSACKQGGRWLGYVVLAGLTVLAGLDFASGQPTVIGRGLIIMSVLGLAALRFFRGPLKRSEQEFKEWLKEVREYPNAPSVRLREVLQDGEEVRLELRMSPLSMFRGDGFWRGLVALPNRLTKSIKPGRFRSVVVFLGALIEAAVLTATLVVVAKPVAYVLLGTEAVAIVMSIWYRYRRWCIETFVVTDRRLILLSGVIGHDQKVIPLNKVTNVGVDESTLARLAAYARLTKCVLSVLVIESAVHESRLRVGFVPATLLQASDLLPVKKAS